MCAAEFMKAVGQGFDHHALARGPSAQRSELFLGERAGIGMGEEACFFDDQLRHRHEVVDSVGVSVFREPFSGLWITVLWRLAEGEERFVAAHRRALTGNVEHRLWAEVGRIETGRRFLFAWYSAISSLAATW